MDMPDFGLCDNCKPPRWACTRYGGYEHDWLDCPECLANYDAWVNEPDETE